MKFCYMYLTCTVKEADSLIDVLLQKRLIVCAKKIPVNATYWWEGEVTKDDEIMLMMESGEEMFDAIEAELKDIHSYDTFVLTAVLMIRVSKDAQTWLEENLQKGNQ